jgi:RNA polymerase I specific initiation factor
MAHWQWDDLYKHSTSFLFSSPDGKVPSTARKVHIRRLCDILHLSIQRGDLPRARRAFALLARCEEIEWMTIWKIGLLLLTHHSAPGDGDALRVCAEEKHIDFLRVMMLQHPEQVGARVLTFQPSRVVFKKKKNHSTGPPSSSFSPTHLLILAHHLAFLSANHLYRS